MTNKSKLFNRDFLLLWLGQSVSQLGNGAGFIGLMWWIQTSIPNSALALGTLAMIQTLIGIAVGPFAGALADRLNRKAIIVLTDFIRGVNYLVLFWLISTNQLTLPVLYCIGALNAFTAQFFSTAISASIPLLVPNERLEQANSLNQVTNNLVNIIGFGVGGVLVAMLGIPLLMVINGISFLISALSELFITIPQVVREKVALSGGLFLRDIRDGFIYMRRNNMLLKILQVAMVLNFFGAPFFILLPKFVDEFMGAGSEVYGYIMSAQMLGALMATLVLSTTMLVKNNLWLVRWSLVVQAVLYLSLPFLPVSLWALHIAVFVICGAFNTVVNIYFATIIQRITPPEYMGKVFGLVGSACQALQPASQGLTGLVADAVRLPIIFTVSSLAFLAGGFRFATIPGLMGFLSEQKEIDNEKLPDPALANA